MVKNIQWTIGSYFQIDYTAGLGQAAFTITDEENEKTSSRTFLEKSEIVDLVNALDEIRKMLPKEVE